MANFSMANFIFFSKNKNKEQKRTIVRKCQSISQQTASQKLVISENSNKKGDKRNESKGDRKTKKNNKKGEEK